jgi:hypothetical protein
MFTNVQRTARTPSCESSCFKRNGWGHAGQNGGIEGFVWGGRRGSTPADMTEMPEARLDWALEDAQPVSIMLSSRTSSAHSRVGQDLLESRTPSGTTDKEE